MKTAPSGKEIPLSWFGKTLWKFSPLYLELIVLAACLRLIGLVEPFIFQVIIDRILPFQRAESLIAVVVIFAAASIFQIVFSVLSSLLGMLTANRVTRELGFRIFGHLFRLPFHHFRKWSVGESIARISETDTIHSFLIGTTTGVFLDLAFVFIYVLVLMTLSAKLTTIILLAFPFQFLIYVGFGPFLRQRLRKQFDAGAAHQSQMVENLTGIAAVKALSAEDNILARLDATLNNSLNAGFRVGLLHLWNQNALFLLERAVTIAVIFFGAQQVFAGQMTLGELIAFHLVAEKVTGPVGQFASLWESWQNIRVSRQRLGDILNTPQEPFGQLPKLPNSAKGGLQFHKVEFHYDENAPILTTFEFSADPGTLTLIIGPSGCGKTTFGKLASGIERPVAGKITLDGHDISVHDPHDVRKQIAYVPQEPYLFTGTLRENMLIGKADAEEAEIVHALRAASAESMITELPDGLDTHVGERGSALSGGQRQRVAIARSILTRPKVLILDEPTSALDRGNQLVLAQEVKKLKKDITLIIITHTEELFEQPDQIIDFGKTPL